MESRITIDVDIEGQPQIRIDFNTKGEDDDVRDKLIGRMVNHLYPGGRPREVVMDFGHEHANGMVAFVRLGDILEEQKKTLTNIGLVRWVKCSQKLPPRDGSYYCKVFSNNEPPCPTILKAVMELTNGEWEKNIEEQVMEWLDEDYYKPF